MSAHTYVAWQLYRSAVQYMLAHLLTPAPSIKHMMHGRGMMLLKCCMWAGDAALVQQRYALGGWSSVRALFRREAVLMYRHRLIYALRFVQVPYIIAPSVSLCPSRTQPTAVSFLLLHGRCVGPQKRRKD